MKGQTGFILALVFALIVAVFAVINVDSVEVNYLFGTGQAPLILVILGSVLMGGLIAGVFGTIRNYQLKREKRSLQRKIEELEGSANAGQRNEHAEQKTENDNLETTSEEKNTEK